MKVTEGGRRLMQHFEGLRLLAYQDTGGVWTIGYGTVRYPPWHLSGRRVRQGDVCTREQADLFFAHDLVGTEAAVDGLTVDTVTPRQFDALCSLTYNIGPDAYRRSTLRRLVNANPRDPAIREQFLRWIYDNGVIAPGLRNRRLAEVAWYFGDDPPDQVAA